MSEVLRNIGLGMLGGLLVASILLEWWRRWCNKMLGVTNTKDIGKYIKDHWSDETIAAEVIHQVELHMTKESFDDQDLYYIYENFEDDVPLAACSRKAQAQVIAESFGVKNPFITKDKPGELERTIKERRDKNANSD